MRPVDTGPGPRVKEVPAINLGRKGREDTRPGRRAKEDTGRDPRVKEVPAISLGRKGREDTRPGRKAGSPLEAARRAVSHRGPSKVRKVADMRQGGHSPEGQ